MSVHLLLFWNVGLQLLNLHYDLSILQKELYTLSPGRNILVLLDVCVSVCACLCGSVCLSVCVGLCVAYMCVRVCVVVFA